MTAHSYTQRSSKGFLKFSRSWPTPVDRLSPRPSVWAMDLPVMPPVSPMLAKLSRELPEGDVRYEPKWDGFRCIVFRDAD